jgi:hypothetical protein
MLAQIDCKWARDMQEESHEIEYKRRRLTHYDAPDEITFLPMGGLNNQVTSLKKNMESKSKSENSSANGLLLLSTSSKAAGSDPSPTTDARSLQSLKRRREAMSVDDFGDSTAGAGAGAVGYSRPQLLRTEAGLLEDPRLQQEAAAASYPHDPTSIHRVGTMAEHRAGELSTIHQTNAARHAAMLASFSKQQAHSRLVQAEKILLLSNSSLLGGIDLPVPVGNPLFLPSRGIYGGHRPHAFDQAICPSSLVDRTAHSALLGLHGIQAPTSVSALQIDAHARLVAGISPHAFTHAAAGAAAPAVAGAGGGRYVRLGGFPPGDYPLPESSLLGGAPLGGFTGTAVRDLRDPPAASQHQAAAPSTFFGAPPSAKHTVHGMRLSPDHEVTRRAWMLGDNPSHQGASQADSISVRPSPLFPRPQVDETPLLHFSQRSHIPLATDEDQNWLSEFLCFVRLDLVEVFRANQEDVRSRNSSKKIVHAQVGIRCRHCAHLPWSVRPSRSSSYPSSLSRIYQSLTMMLRDHFGKCDAIPPPLKQRFIDLKGKTSQGATDSKHYSVYSAMKRGLVDSKYGIWVAANLDAGSANKAPSCGAATPKPPPKERHRAVGGIASFPSSLLLVTPGDSALVSEFLFTLMTQVQPVWMEESERTGNRKSLVVGLPGIGCRHCCQSNRKGLCRLFPVRRRTLPTKISDLCEHIRRCSLCPQEIKDHIASLRQKDACAGNSTTKTEREKEFLDRIWARMGHDQVNH